MNLKMAAASIAAMMATTPITLALAFSSSRSGGSSIATRSSSSLGPLLLRHNHLLRGRCRLPPGAVQIIGTTAMSRVLRYDCNNSNNNIHRLFSTAETATMHSSDPVAKDDEEEAAAAAAAAILSNLKSPFLQTMRDRGFLFQCTNLVELDALLTSSSSSSASASNNTNNNNIISAYLGFDATADSLHVGSLLQIMILRHYQQCGHRPIVLIGGGTSKVGDPTGKDESRILLTDEIIQKNTEGISKVFQKFLTFAPPTTTAAAAANEEHKMDAATTTNDAIMVNNDTWLSSLQYLQFLRDYGTHFTINRMLSFESVKQRLQREAPFSFLEFNYMILQAYDFLELYRRHDARLQLGGSDQWGNMISGVELGRRVDSAQLYALTAPLITTSDGKKMGKTAGGAIWLNSDRLSEYDYWQFWRNTIFTAAPVRRIMPHLLLNSDDDHHVRSVVLLNNEGKSCYYMCTVLPTD